MIELLASFQLFRLLKLIVICVIDFSKNYQLYELNVKRSINEYLALLRYMKNLCIAHG